MKATVKKQDKKRLNTEYVSNELYLDLFLDWANANPELFDKEYPELSIDLTKSINSQPEIIAALIEKLPKLFPIWLENTDKLIGAAKINELKNIASILNIMLTKKIDDKIVENSRQKMLPLAQEYLYIVNSLLDPPQEQLRTPIGFRNKEKS
jgi:hypothetical protein